MGNKRHKSRAKGDRLEHVQSVSTGAEDVWHCEKCHKSSKTIYKAYNPFAPQVEIVGCPNCGSINTMIAGCVECGEIAEGMKDGMWYCKTHLDNPIVWMKDLKYDLDKGEQNDES